VFERMTGDVLKIEENDFAVLFLTPVFRLCKIGSTNFTGSLLSCLCH
jgi:hypothetical protein